MIRLFSTWYVRDLMKLTGYLWRRTLMGAFLLTVSNSFCLAESAAEGDVLLIHRGAIVLSHTGYYDKHASPPGLIDGTNEEYWESSYSFSARPYPHHFVIELDRTYALQRLAVSNLNNEEMNFPGVSAREVVFMGSTESAATGYRELVTIQGKQFDRAEVTLPEPVNVRWLKVLVKSNYGSKNSTELSELEAYGKPVGEAPQHPAITGVYATNYGPLRIAVEGNRVEGCYDVDAGYIWGTADGRVLQINWLEHQGEEQGVATLVLAANGSFLSGLWWEKGVMQGPWFGHKEVESNEIECDIASAAKALGIARKPLLPGE